MVTGKAVVRGAVDLVANLAPWLAPLPTAWLVYERTQRHLQWPWYVAAVAGVTLELLGVGILATWLELYEYNREKRKSDPKVAMWLPLGLVGLYVATAEALTVVLDVWPSSAIWAPAIFPLLSVAAFAMLALRADHVRRLDAIKTQKAEVKAQRNARRAERMQRIAEEAERRMQGAEVMTEEEIAWLQEMQGMTKTMQVKRLAELHPDWTNAMLALEVGCSASTVTRALRNGSKAPEELVEVGNQVSGIGYR